MLRIKKTLFGHVLRLINSRQYGEIGSTTRKDRTFRQYFTCGLTRTIFIGLIKSDFFKKILIIHRFTYCKQV